MTRNRLFSAVVAALTAAAVLATSADAYQLGSRRGWGTTNFLELATGIVTAVPLTVCFWGKTPTAATDQVAVTIGASASSAGLNQFSLGYDNANKVKAVTGDAAANSFASSSTNYALNVWQYVCGVFETTTLRSAYLNGGSKGTNTVSRVPAGINRTTIGTIRQATALQPWAAAGDLANVAVWNVALSDAEILRLSSGISATSVRRESLVAYWPLSGGATSEINIVNPTQPLTQGGTLTLAAPPPLAYAPFPLPLRGVR